jgi:autotransporter-associated beta strand protein
MKPRILVLLTLASAFHAHAGSATWNLSPTSNEWNTAANWTPNTVPNSPTDVATFGVSNTTRVSLSAVTQVGGVLFNPGASAFSIIAKGAVSLSFAGAGVTNNSGMTQNFIAEPNDSGTNSGSFIFSGSATAGRATAFTNTGGLIYFRDSSSAGKATYISTSATVSFAGDSSASRGSFTANDCNVFLSENSDATDATFILNDSILFFDLFSKGGRARIEMSGASTIFVEIHDNPGLSIGSLAGDGVVSLGSNNLTIGTNNRNTIFNGAFNDDLNIGPPGSITKVGLGTLTLSGASTYGGPTAVKNGRLEVSNSTGSGTGTGPVYVGGGTLGGSGMIGGAVIVGSGRGNAASLAPSRATGQPRTLTVLKSLTFGTDGTYGYRLNTMNATGDSVLAQGVTIGSGAQFSLSAVGNHSLAIGQSFTVISNTAGTAIAGTFANLADGSTFSVGANDFQVSYTGGDGNDLTLTVVP